MASFTWKLSLGKNHVVVKRRDRDMFVKESGDGKGVYYPHCVMVKRFGNKLRYGRSSKHLQR